MGSQTALTEIVLTADKQEYARTDDIVITAEFKIQGDLRYSFNEKNWTESYNKFDNLFKLKYGIKVFSGGFRKKELKEIDTYRKASFFWTRNPKLVNPHQEKTVWVQVAKNFEPFIRLTKMKLKRNFWTLMRK